MVAIDGRVSDVARELTTGQANRVWYVNGSTPYVLKHYGIAARAANEAAALTLLAAHRAPAPRLLAADPRAAPPWAAQTAVHGPPVTPDQFLDRIAEPLAVIHRIPGPHAGRLAGARRYRAWRAYLHNRLHTYTDAAPHLVPVAAAIQRELDTTDLDIEPRLLHHDLQVGHLLHIPGGLLLDWELAAYGDPLSDLARLAVRLQLPDPTDLLSLTYRPHPTDAHRLVLYWRVHQLADAALNTDPLIHSQANTQLAAMTAPG
ncbi:aminoglycoside phosphotransferase family protein [Micromonospora sp. NPDC048999]|uniref:phosphotransferase family protein n=1 Tax=Micromonospora sp. NPDC048999 TaxID=3155391 RepID=UPI0033C61B2E